MPRKKTRKPELLPWQSANLDNSEKAFVQIGLSLYLNPEFQALTPLQQRVYEAMLMQAGRNREFTFPKSSMLRYGFDDKSAREAIKALINKGFIEKARSGQNLRKPNVYRFIPYWRTKQHCRYMNREDDNGS